ncbi:glycosyltransferase [Mailhella sp.]
MNQTPILSVLVTFCKQRRYIDDCLRSLIGQKTQYPFEILIAVDGEDDGSMDLLASYAARYEFIHYWKVESDPRLLSLSRASCNRLFLLEKAVGKYFITLDGDDFFCSDQRFEKGIVFLENHSEFIAHTCEWVYYNDCTKSFKTDYKREERCLSLNSYIEENLFHHVSTNMFRNIFLNGTPYPEPYFFDDTVLTSYMLTKGDFYFSAEPMHAYRIGIESIFNSKNELEKNIMACTTCAIKYKITKHGEFIKRIKNYISQIDESKESITLSLKNQILFQEIPVISSIIRLRDKIEREEKWKERKAIQEFLNEYHEDAPVLSVLVTFCRQKQYVDECLQSILMQKTQYSYEVLIAVDGEDDGTMALLSQYQARYPFIRTFMLNYGPAYFSGKRQFGYRVNIQSTFMGLSEQCKNLIQISTYNKISDIMGNGMPNCFAARYIRRILQEDKYDFNENLKNSIIFQRRPLAVDIVRMNELSEEERAAVKANLLFFCEYWELYRKEYLERKHKHSTEKSET